MPNNMLTGGTTFVFPHWFLGLFSLSFVAFIFYLGSLHCRLKDVCKDHPKILSALIRISEILLQRKMANELVFTQSPITLTPEGIQALTEANFERFYETNKNLLLKRIKNFNPKSMADLEENCKTIMLQIEDTLPDFESIKQYAYQHGQPISNILFACAVALRDKAAKELAIEP